MTVSCACSRGAMRDCVADDDQIQGDMMSAAYRRLDDITATQARRIVYRVSAVIDHCRVRLRTWRTVNQEEHVWSWAGSEVNEACGIAYTHSEIDWLSFICARHGA